MVLLGLSIFIASITFLCYRNPPKWLSMRWFTRPSIQSSPPQKEDAPEVPQDADSSSSPADPLETDVKEEKSRSISVTEMYGQTSSKKVLDDRIAMPPPAPRLQKIITTSSPETLPTSPTTPRATLSTTQSAVPTSSLGTHDDSDEEDYDKMPPPSFPSLNSAQRATKPSTTTSTIPPTLKPIPTQPTPGLMLPPTRGPLPNRTPPSSTTGLTPPPSHNTMPTKPRKKVLLTPGHSPLDWAHLTSSPSANLRGLPPDTPYLKVPPSLLSRMNGRLVKQSDGSKRRNDAWTVLGGKVYNISPYLPYHPGGEGELLRCAGKDGTRLFAEVHPWVNWKGMLGGCLVGFACSEEEAQRQGGWGLEEMD